MRRLLVSAIAVGLAFVTIGCSSSDEASNSSSAISPVDVSAENKATCDAIETYNKAFEGVEPPTGGERTEETAAKILAFAPTLVAPLETMRASGPDVLDEPVAVLIASANETASMDANDPAQASKIVRLVVVPSDEVRNARDVIQGWAKENCGLPFR